MQASVETIQMPPATFLSLAASSQMPAASSKSYPTSS